MMRCTCAKDPEITCVVHVHRSLLARYSLHYEAEAEELARYVVHLIEGGAPDGLPKRVEKILEDEL